MDIKGHRASELSENLSMSSMEVIGESKNSKLYLFTENDTLFVLKVLKDDYPDPHKIFQFTNELRNTVDLEIKGIRKAIRSDKIDGKYALVLEYVKGQPLSQFIRQKKFDLSQNLRIIRSIASSLMNLHRQDLIHRDVTTDNVLYDIKSRQTYLIDFGYSTHINLKTTLQGNPNQIEGTLAYISPEQTGRMNRRVDARSDLYSLGIIFYEMLVGIKPFVSEDPLELIHKHLAIIPTAPEHIDESIPKIISNIIMLLLSKNAEDRYQSAYGLYKDLDIIIEQLDSKNTLQPFRLSSQDHTGQFYIPEKLYGRNDELKQLVSLFSQLDDPWVGTMMVSGYSGVGKSSLVNEIIRSSSERKGYFVKGKFDQYQKSMPYYGFIEPFEELCDYLLTERSERFQAYRKNIIDALEGFGQIIIDLIPSLELVIGKQPNVQRLEAVENSIRFNRIFLKFIKALTSEGFPLILFIDDLQWADPASLDLLYTLIVESDISNLGVIGAYRDNEVDEKHPLAVILSKAKEESKHISEIVLNPLSFNDVCNLIADTLNMDVTSVRELSQFIFSKSRGNAFYTKELFKSIYDEELLWFDAQEIAWKFDMLSIHQKGFSENVVEFMTGQISKLPKTTIEELKHASCVGNIFDTHLLSILSQVNQTEIFSRLKPAIKEELIVPLERTFEHATIIKEANLKGGYQYAFSHDRIHQATYSLIDEKDQKMMHLKIGQQWQKSIGKDKITVFEIANQLNRAIDLIEDEDEKKILADLNINAASKAKESTAYLAGVSYLEIADNLLSENGWSSQFESKYRSQKMLGELYYLTGDFEKSEKFTQECLEKAKSNIEKADLYYILILRKTHSSLYTEAIEAARQGLLLLDFHFPEKSDENLAELIQNHFDFLNDYFSGQEVISIAEKNQLIEEKQLATIKLLDNLSMATYVGAEHELWTLQALMKGKYAIDNGISPETGYAFAELGLIYSLYQNYELGYDCGNLSKILAEKFGEKSLGHKGRSFHLISNYIYPWHHHIAEIKDLNIEGFNDCMNSGEMIFAGYINFHEYYCDFYTGLKPLNELSQEILYGIQFNRKIKHDLALDALLALQMCINNLLGNTSKADDVSSDEFNEESFINFCVEKNEYYGIACYYNYKSMVLYLHGEYEQAEVNFEKLSEYLPPLIGSVLHYSTYLFYYTLNKLALYDGLLAKEKEATLDIIEQNIEGFKTWAKPGPENMLHKLLLLQAEQARILNKNFEAQELYHQAIHEAQKGQFIQNEALAYERAGLFWKNRNNLFYAKPHLEAAEHGYRLWGAKSKSNALKNEYPNIFNDLVGTQFRNISTSGSSNVKELNMAGLLKISRALSSEINKEQLLKKLMQVLIQSAGADKVVLISKINDKWLIEADYEASKESPDFEIIALDDFKKVPHNLIQYVARSKKEYFASHAESDKLLLGDSYIESRNPKSAAALPLILKNEIKGIVYLENSVASHTLFNERLDFLRLLLYQITVSLENARLYSDLKELNKAYEKYVPSGFLNILERQNIQDLKLGDQIQKNMTVLFSDIRSYTTMSEKMTPEDNFRFINRYLSTVAPNIRENGGFINQIIGDGIMALFDNAENAIKSSLGILRGVNVFNEEFGYKNNQPIKIGLGLHSGLMMLGIIGYAERFSTGVISNAVNTASRMEGLTKIFGSSIVISENTLSHIEHLENYNYRLLGLIQVKGRQEAIKVYEFYDGDPQHIVDLKSQYADLYNEGLDLFFNRDFIGCASSLRKILDINPGDIAAKRYLERAAQYLVSGVSENWSGIDMMTSK